MIRIKSNVVRQLMYTIRRVGYRQYSEMPDRDKPVKFSTSEAASWRAEFTRSGNIYDDSPDAQPFIISLSTGIFLAYFLWLREESDLDERLNIFDQQSAMNKVEGLEEVQLRITRQDYLKKNKDTTEIDRRLEELESLRLQK